MTVFLNNLNSNNAFSGAPTCDFNIVNTSNNNLDMSLAAFNIPSNGNNSNNSNIDSNATTISSSSSSNSSVASQSSNKKVAKAKKNGAKPPRRRRRRPTSMQQFPGKLHDMMSYIEQWGLDNIVSWVNNGRAVYVRDSEQLVEKILPLFFGQSKFRSFTRQMNMWNFSRIVDGPYRGAFVHPYFVQGQKLLCERMSRHESAQGPKIAVKNFNNANTANKASPRPLERRQQPKVTAPLSFEQQQGCFEEPTKSKVVLQHPNYYQSIINAIQERATADFDVEPIDVFERRKQMNLAKNTATVSATATNTVINSSSNKVTKRLNLLDMAISTSMPSLDAMQDAPFDLSSVLSNNTFGMPARHSLTSCDMELGDNFLTQVIPDDIFEDDNEQPQQQQTLHPIDFASTFEGKTFFMTNNNSNNGNGNSSDDACKMTDPLIRQVTDTSV